jgi:hypothetical protein
LQNTPLSDPDERAILRQLVLCWVRLSARTSAHERLARGIDPFGITFVSTISVFSSG